MSPEWAVKVHDALRSGEYSEKIWKVQIFFQKLNANLMDTPWWYSTFLPSSKFLCQNIAKFSRQTFQIYARLTTQIQIRKKNPKTGLPPFRTTDTDSNTFYYSPYLAELQSAMGAAHGDRECLLKLACLSGKRLSALSGASAVAILLASTTDFMPEAVREPYQGWL